MVPNLRQQLASSLSFITTRQSTKCPPKKLHSQQDVSWRLGASTVVNNDDSDKGNDNHSSCNSRSTLTPPPPMMAPHVTTPSSSSSISVFQNAGTIAPSAVLVGGTALLYQRVLQHPSCSLTPLAVLYMVLLAIQTSLQPRLSRRYIHPRTNKAQVALVEEVVKTSLAAIILVGHGNLSRVLKDWTLQSSLVVAGIPATLYALQGVLTYTSHQHLDAVTFNGLSQTKTLTAALCCYIVLRQPQSPLQMVSLGLLFGSALLFQTTTKTTARGASNSNTDNNHDNAFFVQGVLPCLAATFLSGLAGAFSQRGLQIVGGTGRNAFLYTVEVSACSAVTLLVGLLLNVLQKRPHGAATTNDIGNITNDTETKDDNKDADWTWQTYIPITAKAVGGILTALVHKHAGSVVKGFALMLGLVMSGMLQSLWVSSTTSSSTNDNDAPSPPRSLSINQIGGIVIVMLSSWLHFTNPPSR